MALTDIRVLLAGATGAIGEPVAVELLARGAIVAAVSRSRRKLDELALRLDAPLGRLLLIEGDASTPEGCQAIAAQAAPVHSAVASIGSWWSGPPLVELPVSEWRRLLEETLTAHFCLAQAVVPLVAESRGSYVFINGGAAFFPVANSGPICVSAAGQAMLARVMAAENPTARIASLAIETPVISRRLTTGPDAWLTGAEVARYTAWLLDPQSQFPGGEVIRFHSRQQIPG
jgi:NAD(P)-dependent dehydrogenase (short-subunit alcohol dehydrogenase family)